VKSLLDSQAGRQAGFDNCFVSSGWQPGCTDSPNGKLQASSSQPSVRLNNWHCSLYATFPKLTFRGSDFLSRSSVPAVCISNTHQS
jgi:hypothetical protein